MSVSKLLCEITYILCEIAPHESEKRELMNEFSTNGWMREVGFLNIMNPPLEIFKNVINLVNRLLCTRVINIYFVNSSYLNDSSSSLVIETW